MRLRFLYDYLGGRPDRDRARRLVGDLLKRSARKEREYRRRRKRRNTLDVAAANGTGSALSNLIKPKSAGNQGGG